MKKNISIIILIIYMMLLSTSNVYALDVESLGITYKESSTTLDVNNNTFDNLSISPDIVFNEVGDYITYTLEIKNNDGNKYKIVSISDDNTNEYVKLEYNFDTALDTNNKKIDITLKYVKQLNKMELDLNNIKISIALEDEDEVQEVITTNADTNSGNVAVEENKDRVSRLPITSDNLYNLYIALPIIILGIILILYYKKTSKKGKHVIFSMLLVVALIPVISLAKDTKTIDLNINSKDIKVKLKTATFDYGYAVSEKLIKLKFDTKISFYGYDTIEEMLDDYGYDTLDEFSLVEFGDIYTLEEMIENGFFVKEITPLIKEFKRGDTLPDNFTPGSNNTISSSDSELPIYIYEKDDIAYYYTDAIITYLNEDAGGCFLGLNKIKKIDLSLIDTSKVRSMGSMFAGCVSLETIDLSSFDTSNVTNMVGVFATCNSLKTLDLSSFNTENVTDMRLMFFGCTNLKTLDLNNFDTSNVTDMSSLFYNCQNLESIDLSRFNTSNVTNMSNMFEMCYNLKTLDLSSFDTSKVTTMNNMFQECYALEDLNLSSFNLSNITEMRNMFYRCTSLEILDISSFKIPETQAANISAFFLFSGCTNLKTIYASVDANLNKIRYGSHMFSNTLKLVGEAGTTSNNYHTDYEYAKIDEGPSSPGYFTAKP